jgi:hypothetical protein
MAIITEEYYIGDRLFRRTKSDSGMKIHGGFPEADYEEANDPAELNRTYTETDIPIDEDELSKEEAFDIIFEEGAE